MPRPHQHDYTMTDIIMKKCKVFIYFFVNWRQTSVYFTICGSRIFLKWAHPKICTTSPIFPWFSKWQGESGARQLGPRTTRTETSRPVSEDKSARKRGLVGPYVKTTRTINNYCCLTYLFNQIDGNHKDTVWHLSTVLGNVKKKSQYNQPKPYFFQKIIVKSFLDRFLQILHQNIRNCLYFDWLFTHYVVMIFLCMSTKNKS